MYHLIAAIVAQLSQLGELLCFQNGYLLLCLELNFSYFSVKWIELNFLSREGLLEILLTSNILASLSLFSLPILVRVFSKFCIFSLT